jgi:hypothetical protein
MEIGLETHLFDVRVFGGCGHLRQDHKGFEQDDHDAIEQNGHEHVLVKSDPVHVQLPSRPQNIFIRILCLKLTSQTLGQSNHVSKPLKIAKIVTKLNRKVLDHKSIHNMSIFD